MDDEIAEIVRKHGWFAGSVSDRSPPFLYTVGLMQTYRHPELIVFGLEPDGAHALCSALVRGMAAGGSYTEAGVRKVAVGGEAHRIAVRRVHPSQHPLYLGFAMAFARRERLGDLVAVQAFWADSAGKFPFDAGCDLAVFTLQPRLDIPLTPREVRRHQRQWE